MSAEFDRIVEPMAERAAKVEAVAQLHEEIVELRPDGGFGRQHRDAARWARETAAMLIEAVQDERALLVVGDEPSRKVLRDAIDELEASAASFEEFLHEDQS